MFDFTRPDGTHDPENQPPSPAAPVGGGSATGIALGQPPVLAGFGPKGGDS